MVNCTFPACTERATMFALRIGFATSVFRVPTHCRNHAGPTMVTKAQLNRRKECAHARCVAHPTHAVPGSRPTHCKNHAIEGMKGASGSTCDACDKRPSFAIKGETAHRCYDHADHPSMSNVKKPQCREGACTKRPCYGFEGQKPVCCVTHKEKSMRDLIHPTCITEGCEKRPSFGAPLSQKATHCKDHAGLTMVDHTHPTCLCTTEVCTRQGHFGGFCTRHAPDAVTRACVASSRCVYTNCTRRRAFGVDKALFCKAHAPAGTTYHMKPGCAHPACTSLAWYGTPAKTATACAEHKVAGMIAYPRQRCVALCTFVGTHEDMLTNERLCEVHAASRANVRALVVTKCGQCGLPDVLNLAGLCPDCDPVARKRATHAKEKRIMALLDAHGWVYESHDKVLEGGACYALRPDAVIDAVDHFVVLEVDENQHKSYAAECERTRMLAIAQTLSLPTAFVRYNPDAFVCGRTGRKAHIKDADRHDLLLKWIKDAFHKTDVRGCICVRLCYDGFAPESAAWVAV